MLHSLFRKLLTITLNWGHLGIVLCASGSHVDKIAEACRKGKASFMSLVGAGVLPNDLNPLTCANLLKVIVFPRSLYGCELWSQLSNQLVLQLERMQRFCLKIAQGFGKLTRSDKAVGMIGMPRIQAYITRQKFHLFRRFCMLPAGHTAWDELITYHITESEYEEHAARTAHSDDFLIYDKIQDHFLIYNKIQDHCFRPSLLWEAAKVIPGSLPKFNFVAKMVVSIDHLTSAHPLLCQLCGFLYTNPIIHALSSCSILLSERDHLWEFICNYCSLHLQAYLNSLDDEGFTVVLLGGGGGGSIPDAVLPSPEIHYWLLYRFSIFVNKASSVITQLISCHPRNTHYI